MATCQQNKPHKLYTRALIGDRPSHWEAVAFLISPKEFDPPIEQDRLHEHTLHCTACSNAVQWFQKKKNYILISVSPLLSVKVMVHGKKLAKETLLPSVLEDDDAGAESAKLQLGEVGSWPSLQTLEQGKCEQPGTQAKADLFFFSWSLTLNKRENSKHVMMCETILGFRNGGLGHNTTSGSRPSTVLAPGLQNTGSKTPAKDPPLKFLLFYGSLFWPLYAHELI